MESELISFMESQGHQLTEEQTRALEESDQYLKQNKIFELFEVSKKRGIFKTLYSLIGFDCQINCG